MNCDGHQHEARGLPLPVRRQGGAELHQQLLWQCGHDLTSLARHRLLRVSSARTSAHGLRDITDGSSNTLAFSEGIIPRVSGRDKGPYPPRGSTGADWMILDVWTSVPAGGSPPSPDVTTRLEACNTALRTGPADNLKYNKGETWAWGETGMTLFHTIVPPNSSQYPWGACRQNCAGCSPDDAAVRQRPEPPSRRRQHHDGRRKRSLRQEYGQLGYLVVPGDQGERRGRQRRCVLRPPASGRQPGRSDRITSRIEPARAWRGPLTRRPDGYSGRSSASCPRRNSGGPGRAGCRCRG